MRKYLMITPSNGFVYSGNGFLVLIGWGSRFNATQAPPAQMTLIIQDTKGNQKHICLNVILNQVTAAGAFAFSNAWHNGLMVSGDVIASVVGNAGQDFVSAIECTTLDEAAVSL